MGSGGTVVITNGTAYDLRIRAYTQEPNSAGDMNSHFRDSGFVTVTNNVPQRLSPPTGPPVLTALSLEAGGNTVALSPAFGTRGNDGLPNRRFSLTVPYNTLGLTLTPTWSDPRYTVTVSSESYNYDPAGVYTSTTVTSGNSVTVQLNPGKLPEDRTRIAIGMKAPFDQYGRGGYEIAVSKGGNPSRPRSPSLRTR